MSDSPTDLRHAYFQTLRDEIKETKSRIFRVLMAGIIGAPILTYFAVKSESQLLLLVAPLLILLLVVLYLAEQNELMRAGRYIRENVETSENDWEHWIGDLKLRSAERQLFAMFIIMSLFFYTLLVMMAVDSLITLQVEELGWYRYYFWKYGVMLMYGVATAWALITLVRFWHGAVINSSES